MSGDFPADRTPIAMSREQSPELARAAVRVIKTAFDCRFDDMEPEVPHEGHEPYRCPVHIVALNAALRLSAAEGAEGALRMGERCREGGVHEWRADNGMGGEPERLRVCMKCKSSRTLPPLWHENALSDAEAELAAAQAAVLEEESNADIH